MYCTCNTRPLGGANWNTHAVYSPAGGEAPEPVENAIYDEWRTHVAPHLALAEVRLAAEQADAARTHLDETVRAARAAGSSWADIGRAVGTTRQAARERWN